MNSYAALRPLLDAQRKLAPCSTWATCCRNCGAARAAHSSPRSASASASGSSSPSARSAKGSTTRSRRCSSRSPASAPTCRSRVRCKFTDNGQQGPGGLSQSERDQLQKENGPRRFDLGSQAKPGQKFTRTDFMSAAQLSFPASEVAKIAKLDGVQDAAGSLTLNAVTIKGTVPEAGLPAAGAGLATAAADPAGAVRRQLAQRHRRRRVQARPRRDRPRPDHQGPLPEGRRRSRSRAQRVLRQARWPDGRQDRHARRQVLHGRRARELAARRPVLRRLREARSAPEGQRPRGARQHRAGARRHRQGRRGRREVDQGHDDRRVGHHRRRPRRPRGRLARRRQEPLEQARHGADDRRARGRRS